MKTESISSTTENLTGVEADHVLALAREAFSACKEAASVAKDVRIFEADLDDSSSIRSASSKFYLHLICFLQIFIMIQSYT